MLCSFCIPCQSLLHAAQGMASAGSRRLAPSIAGAETTFCEMVQGNATVQERSFVQFQTHSGWRAASRRATTSSSHEQASRASGHQCGWEIERLKAAIEALGDSTAHVNPLKEALRFAQARVSVRPVEERVESCKFFLERARSVWSGHRLLSTGLRNRKLCTRLRWSRVKRLLSMFLQLFPQVTELQERINALVLERDILRAPVIRGIPREAQGAWMVEDIPPMPHFRHASHRLDEPTQLRVLQCDGVRGSSSRSQDWQFGGTRGKFVSRAVRDVPMEGTKRWCVTASSASGTMQ